MSEWLRLQIIMERMELGGVLCFALHFNLREYLPMADESLLHYDEGTIRLRDSANTQFGMPMTLVEVEGNQQGWVEAVVAKLRLLFGSRVLLPSLPVE